MKFLCLDCDQPMKLLDTEGPDEGSLAVTFRCPECGFRVAMLTNPFETQMVRSLGVKIGVAPAAAPVPFEHLRASLANPRADAFEGTPDSASGSGPGCPFAAMLTETGSLNETAPPAPSGITWTPEAEARIERIPSFIRPMARKAVERLAESKGYATVTEAVMDEARGAFGM
jgi:DNA-directed RNA polymerase subunit RPC12/RpoP